MLVMEEIDITVGDNQNVPSMRLVARRTMDGNIVVYDHADVDIMIQPKDKLIIIFPKDYYNDDVYASQNRCFKYLAKNGVIQRETVEGGDVHGAFQAKYVEDAGGANTLQLVLLNIGKWISDEKPHMEAEQYYEEEQEERMTEPSDEESTDLGDVSQKPKKGSIPKYGRYLAGYGYFGVR